MADHLIDPSLLEQVLRIPPTEEEICLAVDLNKENLLDLEDVTKVHLANGRVVPDWERAERLGGSGYRGFLLHAGTLRGYPAGIG